MPFLDKLVYEVNLFLLVYLTKFDEVIHLFIVFPWLPSSKGAISQVFINERVGSVAVNGSILVMNSSIITATHIKRIVCRFTKYSGLPTRHFRYQLGNYIMQV